MNFEQLYESKVAIQNKCSGLLQRLNSVRWHGVYGMTSDTSEMALVAIISFVAFSLSRDYI